MFKVINLSNLVQAKGVWKGFETEKDAMLYVNGLANAFSIVGFRIASIPTPRGMNYDDAQYLNVVKKVNPMDDNSEEETYSFAIMSYDVGETIMVTRITNFDSWGSEESINYEINRIGRNERVIEDDFLQTEGYVKKTLGKDVSFYINETDKYKYEIFFL